MKHIKLNNWARPLKLGVLILPMIFSIGFQKSFAAEQPKPDTVKVMEGIAEVLDVKEFDLNKDTVKENDKIKIKLNTLLNLDSYTTLFIKGIPVKKATRLYTSKADSSIIFQLQDINNKNIGLFTSWEGKIIKANISVGKSEKSYLPSNSYLYVNIIPQLNSLNVWPWLAAIGVMIVFLVIISLRNHILKDDHNVYYSLGRVQLFYWTLLIIFVYLYIWCITRELPALSGTVLAILGISTVTSGASKVIENEANKTPVKIDPNAKSEGLLYDILSDGSSISIHRFQNVAFNLIIGAIFLQKATSTQAFPEFDNNVLILLGMSSGTYTALKITEAKKSETLETASDNVPVTIPSENSTAGAK